MKRDQVKDSLTQYLQEEIPPDTIQLWPGLKRSLVENAQLSTKQGDLRMNNLKLSRLRMTTAVSILAITFLAGIFLFVTPQGRAFAQDIVKFFTRLDRNEQVAPSLQASLEPQPINPAATEPVQAFETEQGCGSIVSPLCDLATVQVAAPFEVHALSVMPENLELGGALNLPNGVAVKYDGDRGVLLLVETLADENSTSTWTIGSSASIQSIDVNQHPAEFVQGSWSGSGLGEESDRMLVWDESLPARTLRWQLEGVDYTLINFPARGANGPVGYDLLEMKQLAETIGGQGALASHDWQQDGIPLVEAEARAGFSFLPATNIPAGLGLYKTTYNSQFNSICQYYRSKKDDPAAPVLVVAQSSWALPTLNNLQSKANFGDQAVTIAASQEIIQLSGSDGSQGNLIETGLQVDAFCGGESTVANRALLWQKEGRSFVLFGKLDSFAGMGYVSKLELQQIATTLNGKTLEAENSLLDPERLRSLIDAELVANVKISQPAVMLNTMMFDHISVGSTMGMPFMVVTNYLGDRLTLNGIERLLVFQTNNSTSSLAELKLAGGYGDVQVKGKPAIYNEQCSQGPGYEILCNQILSWFEEDIQYDIMTYTMAVIPLETMLTIANSMR